MNCPDFDCLVPGVEWKLYLSFFVHEPPIAKQSMRTRLVPAKGKRKAFIHKYKDPDIRRLEKIIRTEASRALKRARKRKISGIPIRLDIVAIFKKPKSKKFKESTYRLARPDEDNLRKLVKDGLEGAIFDNDKIVADGRTLKIHHPDLDYGIAIFIYVPV